MTNQRYPGNPVDLDNWFYEPSEEEYDEAVDEYMTTVCGCDLCQE